MEYLTTIRNIRNILFKAFLLNILLIAVWWGFVMTNLLQYFMWALPGMPIESANMFVMWLIGAADIAGIVLFLVPGLALSWEIQRTKREMADWEKNKEKFFEKLNEQICAEYGPAKPAKSKPKPKSKAKKK